MSFQAKNNRNTAKRIYNFNSLNNPIVLDMVKGHQGQFHGNINAFYDSNKKNDQIDDKNSLLSITGKQVVCQNTFTRSYNKQYYRHNSQVVKNIKQIELLLQQPLQNIASLIQKRQQSPDLPLNSQYLRAEKLISQKSLKKDFNNQKYYEDSTSNDPILYNNDVSAYKVLQRKVKSKQKSKNYSQKRFSSNKMQQIQKKQNILSHKDKPRLLPKINDNEAKNDQQRKKIVHFNIYREFQLLLNLSNELIMIPQQQRQYKAFIGKGNNGLLIKSIIKSRPWWCIRTSADVDNCNLVWTEWKKPKYMKILPNSKNQRKTTETQNNHNDQLSMDNKKIELVSKILQLNKLNELYLKFDTKSQEEITKLNKKISEPGFSLLAQKVLPNYQRKTVNKANKLVNHIPGCFQLHSKKLLYANLKKYYEKKNLNVYEYLPQTYVISKGLDDPQYHNFLQGWQRHEQQKDNKTKRNIWICKPGENSNRGNGITVAGTLNEIKNFIASHSSPNGMCSALIQKYMQNPFLYNKRKFDIRCYILITTVNGIVKGYWYQDGYIRTTSKQYNLKNIQNKLIHLTNDAVQKKGQAYGKFQNFNKVTFQDFQKYLEQNHQNADFNFKTSFCKMKQMAKDLVHSVGNKLNPDKKQFSFQLFGLDFMLDQKLQAFIIEANSNPCIEVQGNVLGRIIPSMLQNMIRVAIDPIFPPPYSQNAKSTRYSPGNAFQQNKFTLIYDSLQVESSDQNVIISKEQEEQQRMLEAQIQRQNEQQV